MSRAYRVEVEVKGVAEETLAEVMTRHFMWVETGTWEGDGISCFEGEGCLSGGQSESEAHQQIDKALKAANPKALVKTRWTYMDDLPYSTYGDNLE